MIFYELKKWIKGKDQFKPRLVLVVIELVIGKSELRYNLFVHGFHLIFSKYLTVFIIKKNGERENGIENVTPLALLYPLARNSVSNLIPLLRRNLLDVLPYSTVQLNQVIYCQFFHPRDHLFEENFTWTGIISLFWLAGANFESTNSDHRLRMASGMSSSIRCWIFVAFLPCLPNSTI